MITCQLTIQNPTGFHARPATEWVKVASQYESSIQVQYEEKEVNGKSLLALIGLGLTKGSTFSIKVDGPDEIEAVKGLQQVLTDLAAKGE